MSASPRPPRLPRGVRRIFRLPWSRARLRRDLDDEVRFHLQMRIEALRAEGMDPAAAEAEALRRFGDDEDLRRYCERADERRAAATRIRRWLAGCTHDLRLATRQIGRNPGVAAVIVTTLALAIGCSTAAFSIVYPVLLRSSPYPAAGNLRTVFEHRTDGASRLPSYPTVRDWQAALARDTTVIQGVAFVRGNGVAVRAPGDSTPTVAAFVSPDFFRVMGAKPLLGRVFSEADNRGTGSDVAVISYDFFMHGFGGNRQVLGTTVDVANVPTTIIGVMPRGFGYPNWGGDTWFPTALWQPLAIMGRTTPNVLDMRGLHADSRTVLRLRPGADSTRAVGVLHVIQSRLAAQYPADEDRWTSVDLQGFQDSMFGDLPRVMWLISGAIALVLLLGCANVANLVLVRATVRERELVVRAALGAGRARLTRQLLAESLMVVAMATALGLAISMALVGFARHAVGNLLPYPNQIGMDVRVLAFTAVLMLLVTALVGLAPAVYASRRDAMQAIRAGGASGAGNRRDRHVRNVLVSLQFALTVVLLVASGVLIQSVRRELQVPLGYDPYGVVSFAVTPSSSVRSVPTTTAALYARVLAALDAMPGVEASSPESAIFFTKVYRADVAQDAQTPASGLYHIAGPGFLKTFHIPLVAGRWFTDQDVQSPTGLVVTANLAHRLWGTANALGKRITVFRQSQARSDIGQPITLPVIGVVQDVRQFGPRSAPVATVYLPYTLEVWPWVTFDVRASNPARTVRAIPDVIRRVDPALEFRAQPGIIDTGLASINAQTRFIAELLIGFSVGGLLLAGIGLYGMVGFTVSTRRREIGIRIALGATRNRITQLVAREGLAFAVLGLVVGLAGALGTTRLLQSMLFDTRPADPATLIAVPVLLLILALVASLRPARRAARTDPTITMRAE